MTDGNFRPLSVRGSSKAETAYDKLHEGVPDWLEESLKTWVTARLSFVRPPNPVRRGPQIRDWHVSVIRGMGRALRRVLPDDGEWLLVSLADDSALMLDVIDYLLTRLDYNTASGGRNLEALERLLAEGGSAWRATEGGLVHRVDETVAHMADEAMQDAEAGEYLRSAWEHAWGRSPDGSVAYRDAIRAVEAALIPVVSPQNKLATLGTMIADIRNKPEKFDIRLTPSPPLDGVSVFADMLALLWKSQFDRHAGNGSAPANVSLDEGRDAVVLAAQLVHWIDDGAFSRK